MHIILKHAWHDRQEFIFDTYMGPVTVQYHKMDYDTINDDPQMDITLHAFMRCACIMQSRCTITQTEGNA